MPDIFTSNTPQDARINEGGDTHTGSLQRKQVPDFSKPSEASHIRGMDAQQREKHFRKEVENHSIHISKTTDVHKLPGHNHSPLTAYNFYPDNVRFSNADSDEKIIMLLRKHPITNLPWILMAFLLVIAPSFSDFIPLFDRLPGSYQLIFMMIWYMVTIAFTLEKFLDWFFNVDLITDERILDINFFNIMYREVTEANIDEIQEVTFKPAGGIEAFFSYGDVLIQTAAEIPRIVFERVPHPDKVSKVLRELQIEEEIEKIEGRIR